MQLLSLHITQQRLYFVTACGLQLDDAYLLAQVWAEWLIHDSTLRGPLQPVCVFKTVALTACIRGHESCRMCSVRVGRQNTSETGSARCGLLRHRGHHFCQHWGVQYMYNNYLSVWNYHKQGKNTTSTKSKLCWVWRMFE